MARFFGFVTVFLVCSVLRGDDRKNGIGLNSSQEPANVSVTPRVRAKSAEPETVIDRRSDIRVDTTLVLIPVAVTDPMTRFVTGLDKENFKLLENGVEQEISQFSSEDAPLSVGIVFDTSGSMGNKLQKSREAVKQFLKTANPEDDFFLIQFNDRPEVVVGFTPDGEEILNRLTFTQAKGRTALLDAVYMAMNQMKKARNPRKAILMISDGGDNSSGYTESEVKDAVSRSGRSDLRDRNLRTDRFPRPYAGRAERTGSAQRNDGSDWRPAFRSRQSGGAAGCSGKDRHRAAQSICARVQPKECRA
jgi:hypothetical protein